MDACVRCKAGIPDGSRLCPYCEAPQVGKVSKSVAFYDALIIILKIVPFIALLMLMAGLR